MEPPSATSIGQKIDDGTFQILSVLFACLALCIVGVRLAIRVLKLSRFYPDDYVLMFAATTFIGATVMVNLLLPYNQIGVDVGAGLLLPPADIVHILDIDVKYQDTTVILGYTTIFAVKFSFLLFFRQVLAKTGKMRAYWWGVFVFTIPCAVLCGLTEFMVCPAFGEDILAVCVYSGLQRQLAVLYVTIVLDIVSDALLISIPVMLLWRVRMNFRRKLGLGWLLCLSSFCIVCAIVRAVGHSLVNGQDDVVWILFWTHMESCVALIACSMTAFRGLFNHKAARSARLSPFWLDRRGPNNLGSPTKESGGTPRVDMPSMPKPEISVFRSVLMWDPFEDKEKDEHEFNADEVDLSSFNDESAILSNATRRNWHEASSEALRQSRSENSRDDATI